MPTIYTLEGLGARTKQTARKGGTVIRGAKMLSALDAGATTLIVQGLLKSLDQIDEGAKTAAEAIFTWRSVLRSTLAELSSGDRIAVAKATIAALQTRFAASPSSSVEQTANRQALINAILSEASSSGGTLDRLRMGALTPGDKVKLAAVSLITTASVAASAYHGVKRHNGSVFWGVVWGAAGGLFPVITPAIALAQGFGKRK